MDDIETAVVLALAGQREAIVNKIEEAALAMMTSPTADPEGAPLVAAVLRQAAEIARWTAYDREVA